MKTGLKLGVKGVVKTTEMGCEIIVLPTYVELTSQDSIVSLSPLQYKSNRKTPVEYVKVAIPMKHLEKYFKDPTKPKEGEHDK